MERWISTHTVRTKYAALRAFLDEQRRRRAGDGRKALVVHDPGLTRQMSPMSLRHGAA